MDVETIPMFGNQGVVGCREVHELSFVHSTQTKLD